MGMLLLDKGRPLATIADDLSLDEAMVYRYVRAFGTLGVGQYLRAEQPGYWGLLTSAQLAGLRRERAQALYIDCRAIADGRAATNGVRYPVSDLTDLLHRRGFTCHWTTALPG